MKTIILAVLLAAPLIGGAGNSDTKTLRIFIFAGQSNMDGSDSNVEDISRFPPFVRLDAPQDKALFSYSIGRENRHTSNGWVVLQAVDNVVGPELSFARRVSQHIEAPIAIIKCAAGDATLPPATGRRADRALNSPTELPS